MDERVRLRGLAERATPGRWEVNGTPGEPWRRICAADMCIDVYLRRVQNGDNNAAYIAAAHPAAVLALLDAVERAEARAMLSRASAGEEIMVGLREERDKAVALADAATASRDEWAQIAGEARGRAKLAEDRVGGLEAEVTRLRAAMATVTTRVHDAYLRPPDADKPQVPATGDSLLDRLAGIYTVPINDGAGPLNGETTFTRRFPTLPLNMEARAEILRLRGCLTRANSNMEEVERSLYLRLNEVEGERDSALAEVERLREMFAEAATRIAKQSELLSARAEVKTNG